MSQVFISYSHKDERYVNLILRELKRKKILYWYDKKIPPGKNWADCINDAIKDSFALVLIMTPNSRQSDYVNYEWAYALGAGIPIIPVEYERLETTGSTDTDHIDGWHKQITDRQIGDGFDLDKLVESIQTHQNPAPIYIPKHPKISEIESAWADHKIEQYDKLSDIESGCVVAVITNDVEDQELLDSLKQLFSKQHAKLRIVVYTGDRRTSLFGQITSYEGVSVTNMFASFKREFGNALNELKS